MTCEFLDTILSSLRGGFGAGTRESLLTRGNWDQVPSQVDPLHRCHSAHDGYERQGRQTATELDGGPVLRQACKLGSISYFELFHALFLSQSIERATTVVHYARHEDSSADRQKELQYTGAI